MSLTVLTLITKKLVKIPKPIRMVYKNPKNQKNTPGLQSYTASSSMGPASRQSACISVY